jgi:hypothetical protein
VLTVDKALDIPDADPIGDPWETRLRVSLPVQDHRLCVGGDEYRPIRQVNEIREVVAVQRVREELARDLYPVEP